MPTLRASVKKLIYSVTTPRTVTRLQRVVRELENATLEELSQPAFLEEKIRRIGLRYDARGLYGKDVCSMNQFGPGLWQIPQQLAGAVALLAKQKVDRFLEIGTADGFSFCFLVACLSRNNPRLTATTADLSTHLPLASRIPLPGKTNFVTGKTSDDFAGQDFDMSFIDGDHSYEWVVRDYENVGRRARICMFHDINDDRCGEDTVPRFWQELKAAEADRADFYEFLHHSDGEKVMGIGIRILRGGAAGAPAAGQ